VTGGPVKAAQVAGPGNPEADRPQGGINPAAPPAAPPAPAPAAAPMAAPRTITPPPAVQAVRDAPFKQEEGKEQIDPEPTRVPEKTQKPGKRPTDSEPTYVP